MIYRLFYHLVRVYAGLSLYLFFDKIEVSGKNSIPKGYPLIFAPNHQNAFLDGVIALCLSGKVVSFLARADVFNISFLKPVLKFSRIIPVYRLRDGSRNMPKNYDTFRDVATHLKQGKSILIFPEGNQKFTRHLRAIKKGLFRILDQSITHECEPRIIPVGINYENQTKSGFNLVVNFGDPIKFEKPLSNGFVKEKEELIKRINPLIQDIPDYDLQILSESGWLLDADFDQNRIEVEKHWLKNSQFSETFLNKVTEWRHLSFKRGLLPWYPSMKLMDYLLFIPLMIMYLIMLPLKALNKVISERLGTHRAFKLSIVYALALVEMPIYLALLYLLFFKHISAIYAVIFLCCFIIYILYKRKLEKYAFYFKKYRWRKNESEEWERAELLAAEIRINLKQDYKFPL